MSARVKVIPCLLSIFALGAASLAAQAAQAASVGSVDSKAISIEVGMDTGLRITNNDITVGRYFGLGLTISDNLAVGFQNTTAQKGTDIDTFNLFKLAYFMNPALGFSLAVGNDTVVSGTPAVTTQNVAAGAGIFYNIFKNRSESGISTAFKIKVEYLFDARGVDKGDVLVGLGTTFGI